MFLLVPAFNFKCPRHHSARRTRRLVRHFGSIFSCWQELFIERRLHLLHCELIEGESEIKQRWSDERNCCAQRRSATNREKWNCWMESEFQLFSVWHDNAYFIWRWHSAWKVLPLRVRFNRGHAAGTKAYEWMCFSHVLLRPEEVWLWSVESFPRRKSAKVRK